jgi:arylsulfatase A-like enzyme
MTLAPIVALLIAAAAGCERTAARPPDVVLVTLDTTRADHLGVYGYPRPISPAIDAFALDAVRYERAWSTAPWTLPAHASMFTGKHPTSHGAHFNLRGGDASLGDVLAGDIYAGIKVNRLPESARTLAEMLRERGYATAAFAGGPWLSPPFGLLQGYDVQDARVTRLGGRPADALTDAAIAWLRSVPSDRALHLLVNYFDPHAPYEPPAGYDDLPAARHALDVSVADVNRGAPLTAAQHAAYVDRYDGEIRFMDHALGRLLDALRAAGRYDDALIVITADHGESFGEHGLMQHGPWLYDEVLRVPLLVHFPSGRHAHTVVTDTVSLVDLLPLIATEVGLDVPDDTDGVPIGRRDLALAEAARDVVAIMGYGRRFDRELTAAIRWPWKLHLPAPGRPELYRLDEDPGERRDRAGGAEETSLREALIAARARMRLPAETVLPDDVDPKTWEHLRALGYVQ